jgi:uncharacterized protein (DUF433 family)
MHTRECEWIGDNPLDERIDGRATLRDLRISVAHVVNLVANGMTPAEVVQELIDLCGVITRRTHK